MSELTETDETVEKAKTAETAEITKAEPSKPDITLTAAAVLHFQKTLQNKPEVLGVRLGVKNSGCSGLSYVFDFAKEIKENDEQIQLEGVNIIVDLDSLKYLMGTEIDCIQEGLNMQIKLNNPNVKSACGCGESFNTEK